MPSHLSRKHDRSDSAIAGASKENFKSLHHFSLGELLTLESSPQSLLGLDGAQKITPVFFQIVVTAIRLGTQVRYQADFLDGYQ